MHTLFIAVIMLQHALIFIDILRGFHSLVVSISFRSYSLEIFEVTVKQKLNM